MTLIVTQALTVRFDGLVAVDQVDFSIAPRELVGLIGPNGAGKTTFFHALSGVVRPTSGRLRVGGEDVTGRPAHELAWHGVARTFQTPRVFAEMSVADNIRFAFEFAGRRRGRAGFPLVDVASILAFTGLSGDATLPAGAITPARRRRLEIGMALGTAPRALLLDEVAAGLNEAEIGALAVIIRKCRDELGLAVIWIEHAVRLLLGQVERVVVLHQGRMIADGPPAEIARDPAVIAAYLGTEAAP
jgi:branched-chain amino acid transport system ATP-binding protein